jgi:hypothetical protein
MSTTGNNSNRFQLFRSAKFLQVLTCLFGLALVVSVFFVCFPSFTPGFAGEFYDVGLSVSPSGMVKLGVNQSQTFKASVEGGCYPYTFMWTAQKYLENGTAIDEPVTLNTEVFIQWWTDKYFNPSPKPVSVYNFSGFTFATENYFSLTVHVVDGIGGAASKVIYIYDPYTSSTQYLTGESLANFDYKIVTDGLGWYRAVKADGSITAESTNSTGLQNTILGTVTAGDVLLRGVAFDLALIESIPEGVQVVESVSDRTRTFINSADALTDEVSVSVEDAYYFAQDSQNRYWIASSNCTTTIQDALDNGEKIVLRVGDFPVSIIRPNSNNHLTGSGYNSHIIGMSAAYNIIDLADDTENAIIENLRVSHDASIETLGEDGINLSGGKNICVKHVWVENIAEQGISMSASENMKVLNCFFTRIGLKTTEDPTPAPEAAVDIFTSEDVLVSGNHFYDLDDHAIGINGGDRIVISNNIMNDTGKVGYGNADLVDAILMQTRTGTGTTRIEISGNMINTVGRNGIRVNAPTDGNITIVCNQVFGTVKTGISCVGNNVLISDNLVENTGTSAISAIGNNNTVSNNKMFNIGTDGVYTSGNNNKVSDNTINNVGSHGISILTASTNYIVSGNIITSCGQIAASKDGINTLQIGGNIMGNIVTDSTGRMRNGIYLTSTSANVITMGNTVSGAVTANISNVGTDNVIKFNKGFITENSVTSTNTTAITFVFSSGVAGDIDATGNHGNILCTFDPATEASISGYSWVTVTGTATVTIYPLSGASLPAEMTCRANINYIP